MAEREREGEREREVDTDIVLLLLLFGSANTHFSLFGSRTHRLKHIFPVQFDDTNVE